MCVLHTQSTHPRVFWSLSVFSWSRQVFLWCEFAFLWSDLVFARGSENVHLGSENSTVWLPSTDGGDIPWPT